MSRVPVASNAGTPGIDGLPVRNAGRAGVVRGEIAG